MGSRAGDGEWSGGVTGTDAEAGALLWVIRRKGCWWPGRILGADELPENCIVPPPSTVPVKLLGHSDGSIDWYNLEMSWRVKPFRCGDFAECIESAKVRGSLRNEAYSDSNCALMDDAIMHALEIEASGLPNKEPTNQTPDCSKEDITSIREHRRTKMKMINFVTPISEEHHKRDNSSLLQQDQGTMKYQALENDAVGLDARVEGDVFKSTEHDNMKVYDVGVDAYGNYKGHGLPLASLTSKSIRRSIKGYPVTVEILEDSVHPSSTEVHCRAISHFDCLMESRISVPRQARSLRKPSGSRRILEDDLDKSWGPSTRSFSSYCNLPRKSLNNEKLNRKPVVVEDFPPPIGSTSKPGSSPRKMGTFSSFTDTQVERATMEPLVVKGSQPSHSPPVDAMDSESNSDEFQTANIADEYRSDSSTNEYHCDNSADDYNSDDSADDYQSERSADDYVRPTTQFTGSLSSLPFSLPVTTSSRSINGRTALYLCSASTLCAPVRLIS